MAQRPVARIRVRQFDNYEGGAFYIYEGLSYIGKDAHSVQVLAPQHFIKDKHIEIECTDGDKLIFIRNLSNEQDAKIEGITMKEGRHYEFTKTRKLLLGGLITCSLEELTDEERETAPCKDNIHAMILKYRAKQPKPEMQIEEGSTHQDAVRGSADVSEDSCIQSTLTQLSLTLQREDDTTSDYGSVSSSGIEPTIPWGMQSDIPETRLKPKPKEENQESLEATLRLPPSFDSSHSSENFDHDAPTQILDNNVGATAPSFTSPSGTYDPDAPTQVLSHVESVIVPEDNTSSISQVEHAEDATDVVPATPASEYPTSTQEVSAPASASLDDVVQSTPLHLQGQFIEEEDLESRRRTPEQISGLDDAVNVPQTLDDKQHTGMSDVSTQELVVQSALVGEPEEGDDVKAEGTEGTEGAESISTSHDKNPNSDSKTTKNVKSSIEMTDADAAMDPDNEEDAPLTRRRTRRARPILRDSQETSASSSQADISHSSTFENTGASITRTRSVSRQSSRISTRNKEGSPKHGIENEGREDSPPKPPKLIKTESTDDASGSLSSMRVIPGRLTRKSTSERSLLDMEMHRPTVMISAPKMTEAEKKLNRAIIERLGGTYRDDKSYYKDADILVYQGKSRTWKLMCAIARCIPIVTMQWLTESGESGRFLPSGSFLFDGSGIDNDPNITLAESCRMAQERKAKQERQEATPLFDNLHFYFILNKARGRQPGVVISANLVKDTITPMVTVCGGKMCKGEPKMQDKENVVMIASDLCNDETQEYIDKGFRVMRLEFILGSIFRQEVDFTRDKVLPVNSEAT